MSKPRGRYARTSPPDAGGELGWRQRLGRIAVAVPLVVGAVLVVLQQTQFRSFEADVAASWLGMVLEGTVNRFQDVLWFPWSGGPVIGLRISSECTVAILLAPLAAIGALLVVFTRFVLSRLLVGMLVGAVVLVVVNQVRIAVIALSVQQWGIPGYDVGHRFVGTLIGLIGFTLALVVMLKVAAPSRHFGRGRRASS